MLFPGALAVIEHVPTLSRLIVVPITVHTDGELETTSGVIKNPRRYDFELSERYGTQGKPIFPHVASE